MNKKFSWIRRVSQAGTMIWTRLRGELVGRDRFGNRYYREKNCAHGIRGRRWVIYAASPDATKVSPEWHCWLHYIFDDPLDSLDKFHHSWMQPHGANQSGTLSAYFPNGHFMVSGKRDGATGDYFAWNATGYENS